MTIEEKLARLDPNKFDKRSAAEIRAWKDRVPRLSAQKDWIGHPITREWMQGKIEEIQRINALLSERSDLSERERQQLFGEKAAHKFDLAQFDVNPDGELRVIERAIDLEPEMSV